MKTDLVLKALNMAAGHRVVKPGLIFHSDRGSQYASKAFRKVLRNLKIKSSMSRKGNCWDNAVIEVFYNRKRKHSTNGNLSPVDYENSCIENNAMAA